MVWFIDWHSYSETNFSKKFSINVNNCLDGHLLDEILGRKIHNQGITKIYTLKRKKLYNFKSTSYFGKVNKNIKILLNNYDINIAFKTNYSKPLHKITTIGNGKKYVYLNWIVVHFERYMSAELLETTALDILNMNVILLNTKKTDTRYAKNLL